MTDPYIDGNMELTRRLVSVIEMMEKLEVSKLTISADGKVMSETLKRRTYYVSASLDCPRNEVDKVLDEHYK